MLALPALCLLPLLRLLALLPLRLLPLLLLLRPLLGPRLALPGPPRLRKRSGGRQGEQQGKEAPARVSGHRVSSSELYDLSPARPRYGVAWDGPSRPASARARACAKAPAVPYLVWFFLLLLLASLATCVLT